MKQEQKLAIYNALRGKAIAGQGETTAADGGNLVDKLLYEVIPPNFMQGSIYERCNIVNLVAANGVLLPRLDTTDVDTGGYFDALASWIAEGDSITLSKIKFDQKSVTLKKCAARLPLTNELMEDVDAFIGYIGLVGGAAIRAAIERAMIYGSSTELGGITDANKEATVFVDEQATKETTAKLMIASYYGGQNGVWTISQDVWAQMILDYDLGSGLVFTDNGPTLFSYPVRVLPTASSNCMVLADWSQFVIFQKELRQEISEHVYFATDQSSIKLVARLQGAPIWSDPTNVQDTSIVSPFVALSSMETS